MVRPSLPGDLQKLMPHANLAVLRSLGRPRSVLDLGCGRGIHAAIARARGGRAVGVEPRDGLREVACRFLDEVIACDPANVEAVRGALAGRRFDLIVFSDLLDRVDDPVAVLRDYLPMLEPEGRIIIAVRSLPWSDRFGLSVAPGDHDFARHGISEAAARRLVDAAGFDLMSMAHTPMMLRALHATLLQATELRDLEAGPANRSPSARISASQQAFALYRHSLRPLEDLLCRVAPDTLSAQHVVVGRRRPVAGPLSLTVGMLTRNDEPNIAKMIEEIRRHAPDSQILCVDSSHRDATHIIAEKMGARVLRQPPHRGQGPAMELLMNEAAKGADALIYLDCDFTYPPMLIPVVRRILETGIDVVNASRVRTRPQAMQLADFVAKRAFVQAARALHGVNLSDLDSGLRGYRTSVLRAFDFDGEGDAISIDTLLWPAKCGYSVVEFPFDYQERTGDAKHQSLAGAAWTLIRLARAVGIGRRRSDTYQVWDCVEQ